MIPEIDQAITDLQTICNSTDDETITEVANHAADLLGMLGELLPKTLNKRRCRDFGLTALNGRTTCHTGDGLMNQTGSTSAPTPCYPAAKCWQDVPGVIDSRPAESTVTAYGITKCLKGNSLLVDFGNELGDLAFAEIEYRDNAAAWDAYCRGVRIDIKVTAHPEHEMTG